jgi:hypothetical protein
MINDLNAVSTPTGQVIGGSHGWSFSSEYGLLGGGGGGWWPHFRMTHIKNADSRALFLQYMHVCIRYCSRVATWRLSQRLGGGKTRQKQNWEFLWSLIVWWCVWSMWPICHFPRSSSLSQHSFVRLLLLRKQQALGLICTSDPCPLIVYSVT